jgi:hypothetical protein
MMMRFVLALAGVMLLGALAAACAFWAGIDQGAPIAFALSGFTLAILVPVGVGQMENWDMPGDEPPLPWRRVDRRRRPARS